MAMVQKSSIQKKAVHNKAATIKAVPPKLAVVKTASLKFLTVFKCLVMIVKILIEPNIHPIYVQYWKEMIAQCTSCCFME